MSRRITQPGRKLRTPNDVARALRAPSIYLRGMVLPSAFVRSMPWHTIEWALATGALRESLRSESCRSPKNTPRP